MVQASVIKTTIYTGPTVSGNWEHGRCCNRDLARGHKATMTFCISVKWDLTKEWVLVPRTFRELQHKKKSRYSPECGDKKKKGGWCCCNNKAFPGRLDEKKGLGDSGQFSQLCPQSTPHSQRLPLFPRPLTSWELKAIMKVNSSRSQ